MLSKTFKLNGYETFKMLKSNHKFKLPLFDLYWQKNNNSEFKAGLVIAKKLKLKVNNKNHLKRKIFNILRELIINKKPSYYLLFYINNLKILDLSLIQMKKEIKKGFEILDRQI